MKIDNKLVYFVRRLAMNNTTKLFGIFSIAALGAILPCATIYAATLAGQVQFTTGTVQVVPAEGNAHLLKKGDPIYEGDTVNTIVSSSAQIKMKDGGFIAVRHDTKMRFDKFVFKGTQNGEEKSFFSLFKGGFRAVTGLIGSVNKQNYKIVTPAATIGVRGTDHETYFVPVSTALVQAGAYSKVNAGETTLTTNQGTINVLPNQMGFSSGINEVPKLAPINTNVFTVAAAPTKTIKDSKADKSNQTDQSSQGGNQQTGKQEAKQDATPANVSSADSTTKVASNTNDPASIRQVSTDSTIATSNNVTTGSTAPATLVPDTLNLSVPALTVPIVLTNAGTILNATNQTVTSGGVVATLSTSGPVVVTPNPNNAVALTMMDATGIFSLTANGWPTNMSLLSGNFSTLATSPNYTLSWGTNDFYSQTFNVITSTDYGNANSYSTTGIQFGRYTNLSTVTQAWGGTIDPLIMAGNGSNNGNRTGLWAYGVAGYLDSPTTMLTTNANGGTTGTFNYVLDGTQSAPLGTNNQKGSLTGFTLTANFSTNTISVIIAATMGTLQGTTEYWTATDSNMNISGNLFGNNYGGTPTMSVTRGIGAATTTVCTTCSVFVSGGFTGQNYSGIVSTYSLYNSATLTGVDGVAALTRVGVTGNAIISNAAPSATNGYFVAVAGAGFGGSNSVALQNSVTNSGGVLTQWGTSGVGYSSNLTVTCPNCVAGTTSASTGVVFGTWDSGNSSATYTGTYTGGQVAWITGPPVDPFYLPQVLTGNANYILDGGTLPIDFAGTTGALTSATLAVNFTQQTVGLNLALSVAGNSWTASATGMPLTSANGQGNTNAAFYSSTSNPLTVAMTGVTGTTVAGSGSVAGQLTGSALNGALFQYQLTATVAATTESVNGVVAMALNTVNGVSATSVNTATPYQLVATSRYAAGSATSPLQMNGTWNNQSQVTVDAAGNLIGFNESANNNNGSLQNATSASIGAAVATNTGTDPISGISWGRWQGPGWTSTNLTTGAVTTHLYTSVVTGLNQPASLHWITGPVMTGPVALPITGTYTYTLAGGTNPTDNLGNVGTLNSASLAANFTAKTVNVGVNATVNSVNYVATGSNLPIINTVFSKNNGLGTFTATANGVATTGDVGGSFTGSTGNGALVIYGFLNGATVVNGVAAFHR